MPTNENMKPIAASQYGKLIDDPAVKKKDDDDDDDESSKIAESKGYFCYPILAYVVGLHTLAFISFILFAGKMKLLTYLWSKYHII